MKASFCVIVFICGTFSAARQGFAASGDPISRVPSTTTLPAWPDSDSALRREDIAEFRERATPKVFFPAVAPTYGAPLQAAAPRALERAAEPPDHLGNYVGEFFYPALSTRLGNAPLDRPTSRLLAAYMAHRSALLNDLQNELVVVQNADAATRESELRAFAVVQTPRIIALEAEADALREKLIDPGFLHGSVDWSRDRKWKTGDGHLARLSYAALAEFQVLRAAAYYQKGLSPEQRGMLCELVEPPGAAPLFFAATGLRDNAEAAPFFAPEMSRLPTADLPAALVAKLREYSRIRDAVKAELMQTIVALDNVSRGARDVSVQKLASDQWPRFAELAERAEAIRREVATLPTPPPPPRPPQIPSDLVTRMDAYKADEAALRAERIQHGRTVSNVPLFGDASLSLQEMAAQVQDRIAERRDRVWQADEAFRRENAERFAALERRRKALAQELMEFAGSHLDRETGRPMDLKTLLRSMVTAERYFEQIAREEVLYKDYRTAMLEPGLSPEQRRLLFSAARVALAQALPTGEAFPSGYFPRRKP